MGLADTAGPRLVPAGPHRAPPIALCHPVYRAECVPGFVMGMSVFPGAILPMIAALVFAAAGALPYHGGRFIWSRLSHWRASS